MPYMPTLLENDAACVFLPSLVIVAVSASFPPYGKPPGSSRLLSCLGCPAGASLHLVGVDEWQVRLSRSAIHDVPPIVLDVPCEGAAGRAAPSRGALAPVSEGGVGLCRAYNERLYAYFPENCFDGDDLIGEEEFLGVCDFLIERLSDIARAMRREREGKPYDLESANILVQRCLALCFTGNGDLLSQWRGTAATSGCRRPEAGDTGTSFRTRSTLWGRAMRTCRAFPRMKDRTYNTALLSTDERGRARCMVYWATSQVGSGRTVARRSPSASHRTAM